MSEMMIICGDDGKQIAFRGTCPKCGGESWIPAGHPTLMHVKDLGEDTLNEIRKILKGNASADSDGLTDDAQERLTGSVPQPETTKGETAD